MTYPPNVLWGLGIIIALLIIATIVVIFLKKQHPDKNYQELGSRIKTWWIITAMFAGVLLANKGIALAFFAFISYLALKEYLSLIPTRRADRRVLFWAYLAIPVQYWWVYSEWYGMFIIFIPVYMFLYLPMRMVLKGETDGFLKAAGTLHWGLMTTVFSLSHASFLLVLPKSGNPAAGGAGLVLYLVCLTELNDVAQYIWGKTFGKHKVVPLVSPNKTWEGLMGGVATTVVLAVLSAPYLTPLNFKHSLLAGLIIGLGGFLGDITVSAVKRDLKIKDSSNLLPGHGGILDRVDSLTFTAPLFLHFLRYLYF
jgi:phosphatidate cytidylyltransferase